MATRGSANDDYVSLKWMLFVDSEDFTIRAQRLPKRMACKIFVILPAPEREHDER